MNTDHVNTDHVNTFNVKYYEDIALAYWVKQKPMEKFQFEQVVREHEDEIIECNEKAIDFHHSIRWVMFNWGWVIETCHFDREQTTTIETLISYNGKTGIIIHRHRFGPNYDKMKPCQRDYILPVPSIVRLLSCSK